MKRIPWFIFLWVALAAGLRAQTPIDQTKAVKPDGRVYIENVAGSVSVTGWDRSEVRLTGTLGKETEPLVFDVSGAVTRIEVHPTKSSRGGGEATLVVQVPRKSRVEVDAVSADVAVKEIASDADLHTVSGDIRAASSGGDLRAETVSGSVRASTSGRSLRLASVSGELLVEGASPSSVEFETVSGSITYDGALARNGEIKAESVSGPVTLRLPKDVSADFSASSFSGEIKSTLAAPLNLRKDGPVGKSAEFTSGSGEGRVKVETFSGRIDFVAR